MSLDVTINTKIAVTGESFSGDDFRVVETIGSPNEQALIGLLEGKLLAHHVRRAVDPRTCQALVENFHCNPGLISRSGEVPADCVGSDHFNQALADYMSDSEEARPHLDALFRNTNHPVAITKRIARAALAKYCPATLRAAEYGGRKAGDARGMIWRDKGEFALAIHEDYSQMKHPLQRGFEIQQVNTPVAVNLYASVPQVGGGLRVWNLIPDVSCRVRYGVEHTGYPYPADQFEKIESLLIEVEAGDIVFLNGTFCHAVEKGADGDRLLISYFMGFSDDKTVVWWT